MIITFDLQNLNASSGDMFIVDNCKDLRVTRLDFKRYNRACDDLEKLQIMNDYVCKKWFKININEPQAEVVSFSDDDFKLLEFSSNDINYYIITEGKAYIANDENKTFKVIN